ncbi:HIR complex subunit [Coelomomyces lativittatus]|nr:HIR complex subunit [Coelomomyces lativittatus]
MDSDVIDLAWSYDNRFLASCSLDNSIVVWDGHSFERVARCMHHSFVKGLSFDPIGQFLVSQSDDGSAVLWDVSTWRQYKKIAHPFVKGAVAGFVRRPCWSPDADYLACVNAVSQGVHVAAVIPRNKWWEPRKCIHLVGHSAPVCVAKFSPIVFHDPKDPDQVIRILALGSNDRRISIWALKKNPLIILENIFQSDIMDLVWSPDGQVLLASAREGRVAGIHFPRLTFFGWTPMKPNTFLDLMKQRHQFDPTHVHVVDHKDIVTSTESLKPVFPTPQKITHTKDGRKRIQPTLIASLSISGLQSTQPPPKLFKMPSHGSENLPSPFGGRCGSPSPFSGSITSSKRSTSSPPFSCSSCSSCTYFAFSRLKPSDTSFCLPLPPTIDTSFLAPLEIPEVGHVNVLKQSNETVFQISFLNSFETLCKVTFPNSQGPVFTKFSMNSMYFAVGTHSIPPRLYVYKFEDSKAILWMDGLCLLAPLYQCSLYQQMYLSLLTCDGKVYVYDLSQRTLLLKSSIRHLLLTTSASTSTMLMPATTTSSSSAQPLLSSPSIELSLIPWRGESSWTLQFQVNQVVYTYHPGLQGFY